MGSLRDCWEEMCQRKWDKNEWKNCPNTTVEDDDSWVEPCLHPAHNPPIHIWIPSGKKLRHKCPGCGKETVIYGNGCYL